MSPFRSFRTYLWRGRKRERSEIGTAVGLGLESESVLAHRHISKAIRLIAALPLVFPAHAASAATHQVHGHNAHASDSARGLGSATTDGLSCATFQWDNPSTKAVMRVPISLNGELYWYQLDTGADVVIPYGSPKHEGWSKRGDAVRIPNVHFAGMSFPAILAYPMENMPDSPDPRVLHGTVGLDLLVGHVFVIDFPKRRVCLLERADLRENLSRAADWTAAEIRHGKLFLKIDLNGRELNDVFYDTGSSPDALDVDLSMWKEATGRSGPDEATRHGSAQTWGRQLEFISAPASGDLRIGHHVYRRPLITTNPTQPAVFRTSYKAQGALGNALFKDSIIVLDLGSHPQFGIVDSRSQ